MRKRQGRQDDNRTWEGKDLVYFRETVRSLTPERNDREMALSGIRQAVGKKTISPAPSLWGLAFIELQYISPLFWILQGLLVGTIAVLLGKTSMDGGTLADYLQWISVLAAWMGVVVCGTLSRHFARGMAELEQSCYFNLPQIWAIKMALAGTVDALALTICSGRIAGKTGLPFGQVCLYVLVPFVLSNVCCLYFLTALRGGRNRYGLLVMAFVTGIAAMVPGQMPAEAYAGTALWRWAAALGAGVGLYLWQLWRMWGKIRKGEMVCWN